MHVIESGNEFLLLICWEIQRSQLWGTPRYLAPHGLAPHVSLLQFVPFATSFRTNLPSVLFPALGFNSLVQLPVLSVHILIYVLVLVCLCLTLVTGLTYLPLGTPESRLRKGR